MWRELIFKYSFHILHYSISFGQHDSVNKSSNEIKQEFGQPNEKFIVFDLIIPKYFELNFRSLYSNIINNENKT